MEYTLKICKCGHAAHSHTSSCQELIPNNEGHTHVNSDLSPLTKCDCKRLKVMIDLSKENIHIE
jgi:hypothetical protein